MWLEEHLRHSRGYGIHSPFLYRVVREAMMPRRVVGESCELYEALRAKGVSRRTAVRIQNLFTTMGYGNWAIDRHNKEGDFVVATRTCADRTVVEMVEELSRKGGAVCVIHSLCDSQRRAVCKELIEQHRGLSASKPTLKLFFGREGISKQHIVI